MACPQGVTKEFHTHTSPARLSEPPVGNGDVRGGKAFPSEPFLTPRLQGSSEGHQAALGCEEEAFEEGFLWQKEQFISWGEQLEGRTRFSGSGRDISDSSPGKIG